jgi:hypothetical protein
MAEFAKTSGGEVRGLEFAPINFGIADDLSYWSAERSGKALATAEALMIMANKFRLLIHLGAK